MLILSAGLSSGATAAIVICMLLLCAALICGGVWFYFVMKKRNFEFNKLWQDYQGRKNFSKLGNGNSKNNSGFDNVAYVTNPEGSQIHNDILDSA